MQDRIPLYPGRVKMTPVAGQANTYDMVRADDPTQAGTPLNKATLLKDATAALFGLTSSAVPDDIFAAIGKYKQYWWRRRTITKNGVWEKVEDSFSYGAPRVIIASENSGDSNTINVSGEITIDQSNGAISLSNPTSVEIAPNSSGVSNVSSNLPGKYFVNTDMSEEPSNPQYAWIKKNEIYFLQSGLSSSNFTQRVEVGAQVITTSSNVYIYKISSKFTLQSITYGDWQYIQSSNRNAYPDNGTQDGYEYEYLGVPFDNAVTAPKIETGSYIGTGTYGVDNPNTLTFGFVPKLVFINDGYNSYGMFFTFGTGSNFQTAGYAYAAGGADISVDSSAACKLVNKELSWYNTSSNMKQFNVSARRYSYLAIG